MEPRWGRVGEVEGPRRGRVDVKAEEGKGGMESKEGTGWAPGGADAKSTRRAGGSSSSRAERAR